MGRRAVKHGPPYLGPDTAIALMGSEQPWSPAQDQARPNPGTDGAEDLQAPCLTEELLAVGSYWERTKSFFFEDVATGTFLMI